MRIIAGKYRGKQLFSPKVGIVRPTSDRAREALFNILTSKIGNDWSDYTFLDVFAGTGAVGFEALSRGVAKIGFVDINIANAKKNAELFSAEAKNISFYKADATAMPQAMQPYDIIFADAPYDKGFTEKTILSLINKGWLADKCILIVETQKTENIQAPDELLLTDCRIYGPAKFWFFTRF